MRRECGERFPRHWLQRKQLVSDPGIHHGTCVTHVPWCMSGSLTWGGGENVPGIPGACASRNCTYLARGPWSRLIFIIVISVLVRWPFMLRGPPRSLLCTYRVPQDRLLQIVVYLNDIIGWPSVNKKSCWSAQFRSTRVKLVICSSTRVFSKRC